MKEDWIRTRSIAAVTEVGTGSGRNINGLGLGLDHLMTIGEEAVVTVIGKRVKDATDRPRHLSRHTLRGSPPTNGVKEIAVPAIDAITEFEAVVTQQVTTYITTMMVIKGPLETGVATKEAIIGDKVQEFLDEVSYCHELGVNVCINARRVCSLFLFRAFGSDCWDKFWCNLGRGRH